MYHARRHVQDEIPYVRRKSELQSVFSGIENFMRDLEESLPSDQVDDVVKFCQNASPDDLRSGGAAPGRYRRAWLDDRKWSPIRDRGIPRRYPGNPLTPSQLYQILQAQVRNIPWSKLREAEMGRQLRILTHDDISDIIMQPCQMRTDD